MADELRPAIHASPQVQLEMSLSGPKLLDRQMNKRGRIRVFRTQQTRFGQQASTGRYGVLKPRFLSPILISIDFDEPIKFVEFGFRFRLSPRREQFLSRVHTVSDHAEPFANWFDYVWVVLEAAVEHGVNDAVVEIVAERQVGRSKRYAFCRFCQEFLPCVVAPCTCESRDGCVSSDDPP